jgi:hypothetical protein
MLHAGEQRERGGRGGKHRRVLDFHHERNGGATWHCCPTIRTRTLAHTLARTHTCTHAPGVYPGSCRPSDFPMRASQTHRLSRRGPPKSVKMTIFTLFHRISQKNASAHRISRCPPPKTHRVFALQAPFSSESDRLVHPWHARTHAHTACPRSCGWGWLPVVACTHVWGRTHLHSACTPALVRPHAVVGSNIGFPAETSPSHSTTTYNHI